MKSSRTKWIRGVGAVVLVGGLIITGWGLGVTSAAPPASNPENPFQVILDKLDQIQAAITGGGGGQDGNHTLRWDTAQPAATRFVVLPAFNSDAVLDKNTGLVWEKSPPGTVNTGANDARFICNNKFIGGQKGWRLPSIPELASLVDPANINPALPTGHPFTNVQSANYWSASTHAEDPSSTWNMSFGNGVVNLTNGTGNETGFHVWCVRGGMNADVY